jgi:hypothetical protein
LSHKGFSLRGSFCFYALDIEEREAIHQESADAKEETPVETRH